MLTIDMNRLIRTVGRVVAAATSIVLAVLALTSSVLTVHADQEEWAEVTATPVTAPVDHGDFENGGGSAWG